MREKYYAVPINVNQAYTTANDSLRVSIGYMTAMT